MRGITMKIIKITVFFIFSIVFISCASTYYSIDGINTNQYGKSLDLEKAAMIYIPDEIRIWECDGQAVGNAWSSDRTSAGITPFIVVLTPGEHIFNNMSFSVTTGTYRNSGYKTADYLKISYNYQVGHIYDLQWDIINRDSFNERLSITIIDKTDNPGEEWQKWINSIKTYQIINN
jgi:hypothetical protein